MMHSDQSASPLPSTIPHRPPFRTTGFRRSGAGVEPEDGQEAGGNLPAYLPIVVGGGGGGGPNLFFFSHHNLPHLHHLPPLLHFRNMYTSPHLLLTSPFPIPHPFSHSHIPPIPSPIGFLFFGFTCIHTASPLTKSILTKNIPSHIF